MTSSVSIYERQSKVLVVPLFQIEGGGHVEKGPVHVIDVGNWRAIGEAVLGALAAYEVGLPIPDWSTYPSFARDAAGAQTENEFETGLKGCSLEFGSEQITVTPDETKIGRGLIPLVEAEFQVPLTNDPQLLGEIVREGLSRTRA